MATVTFPGEVGSGSIFEKAQPGFRENFDEQPFEFAHTLTTSHPLFEVSAIRRLLDNPAVRNALYYDAGNIRVDQRWDSVPTAKPPVEQVFDQISTSGAWIILRHVDQLPDYRELLDSCLAEVKKLSGREIDSDKKSQEAMIFFTSPRRITSYHIDRECNFLMQVSGEKTIHVFDRNDRDVVPEHELETFWSKDNNAGVYKPQFEDRARVYTMRPGSGVHIPVNSPHWLENGDNVSISFSVSYQYKDWRRKNVYQANYYLRKLGLHPTPPGRSAALDATKRIAVEAGLRAKKFARRKNSKHA